MDAYLPPSRIGKDYAVPDSNGSETGSTGVDSNPPARKEPASGSRKARALSGANEMTDKLRTLIDSAGGAKCKGASGTAECNPRNGGTLCQWCGGDILPQPAEDDGAVACPRCDAPCTTTEEGCVDPMIGDTRYTAYHYARPSAAAAVDDAMVARFMVAFNCEAEGNTNTRLYDADDGNVFDALTAALAQPQGSA